MRKSKAMAVLLSFVMTFTFVCSTTATSAEENTPANLETNVGTPAYSLSGTNSFGKMLSNEIAYQSSEPGQEAKSCVVYSAEVTGKTVSVGYQSAVDCTLLAAVFDDKGEKLLGSGTTGVSPENNKAEVTVDIANMPEYFYLRVYMVDTKTLEPLNKEYNCQTYTRAMQEFLSKTTDDFEEDKVRNLDGDKSNNFMVYNEDVIIIEHSDTVNTLESVDDDNKKYVIGNADDTVKSLKKNDIFVYELGKNSIVFCKVDTVSEDNGTVTFTGKDMRMQEILDYVKIDTIKSDGMSSEYPGKPIINDDGSAYMPDTKYNDSESGLTNKLSDTLTLIETDDASVELGCEFEGGFKYYQSDEICFWDLKLDYEFVLSLNMTQTFERVIEPFKEPPIKLVFGQTGLVLEITPSLGLKVEGKIETKISFYGTVGVRYTEAGFENISTYPDSKVNINASVTIEAMVYLTTSLAFLHRDLLSIAVPVGAGFEINVTDSILDKSLLIDVYKHDCLSCYSGEFNTKITVNAEVRFLARSYSMLNEPLTYKWKIFDFYFCISHGEGGRGSCPRVLHKVYVEVLDDKGAHVGGEKVTLSGSDKNLGETNMNGEMTMWLGDGTYTITAERNGKRGYKTFTINGNVKYVTLNLNGEEEKDDDPITPNKPILCYSKPDIRDDDIVIGNIVYRPRYAWIRTYPDGREEIIDGSLASEEDTPIILDYGACDCTGSPTNITILGSVNGYPVESYSSLFFKKCPNLRSITINCQVESVGDFENLKNLVSVTLPASCKTIEPHAFEGCTSLKRITIPRNVQTISGEAFKNCTSLQNLTIPNSVTTLLVHPNGYKENSRPNSIKNKAELPYIIVQ